MFWSTFESLCANEGRKPNPVANELGIPSGSLTKWKNGSLPSVENLIKIASHFGVTIDYLITGQIQSENLSDDELEWLRLFRLLSDEEKDYFKTIITLYIESHKKYSSEEHLEKVT